MLHPIFFITGNQNKLREAQTLIPHIQGIDLDLPELQELDAHAIIAAKLTEAQKHHPGPFIVEDTSLYLDSMNGLPGPLIKWFIKSIGLHGIHKLTETFASTRATARTIIGYSDPTGHILFFEGSIPGTIVPPRGGTLGFGWDDIFQPDGSPKTFSQMDTHEKNHYSMRKIALTALQHHLSQQLT